MATRFDLVITADSPTLTAEFRLLDAHGGQIGFRQTDFRTLTASRFRALFDLRNFVRLYVEEEKKAAALAEIGVCIAEEVLGREIFEKLWLPKSQRTLCVQLSGATREGNYLAAVLSRVPWEIARPGADQNTLSERNLLVRVVHDTQASASRPVELAADEPLRVLFVFAEARGSRPLGARQERTELLRLLEKEIYPQRRVVAHFLTHGVTRERLIDQIQQNGGYHVVHWSGHGHLNQLELAKPGGAKDLISGDELLDLFTNAGGFFPRLFFLSACHSGDILRVKDWNDVIAIALGKEPGTKETDSKNLDLAEQPGFTGTAHALLQGGVPSVVAMRYAVGDDYARELAVEFYRALLAHDQPKNAAAALTLARQDMLDGKKHDLARFAVCDHATPVLYGAEQPGLTLAKGRSPELNPRNPRLHRITELTTARHQYFVGRTWDLAGLGAEFIGSSGGKEVHPVAVVTGLGGMGKTALVAEALALWEMRFKWVLLYQANPNALGFDAMLHDIDLKLRGELGRYHDHVKAEPADAIYRHGSAEFAGAERLDRLTRNLLRAMKDEPILLVLDNFETNLKPQAAGEAAAACQDPAWDCCLSVLAKELIGSASRVLITSRRPLAALAGGAAYSVLLGPLPPPEAALYLKEHPVLSGMVFGADAGDKALALRLLNVSRFHPLLMDRLARLAAAPAFRLQLLQMLDTMEKTKGFSQIPALFATTPGDQKELAYLSHALATSLDQLIRDAGPDARRLLWMVGLANEPVPLALLEYMWSEEDPDQQQLRQIKKLIDRLPQLPAGAQDELEATLATLPKLRAMLDVLPPAPPHRPKVAPLLRMLVDMALLTEERTGSGDANLYLTCHELVRVRIRAWMQQQPQDRGDLTENAIYLAYAKRLEAAFLAIKDRNMTAAAWAGGQSLVYYVQAEAWESVSELVSQVLTCTRNPHRLEELIQPLRIAAESAPEGAPRWTCLLSLATGLSHAGHPGASMSYYEQAATQARAVAEAGGEGAVLAWDNLATITSDWGTALAMTGNLYAARQRHLEAAGAGKAASSLPGDIIGRELEALRVEIMLGQVAGALPQVESRLKQVETWWYRHRSGQSVPEAPDAVHTARMLISALDIAKRADLAREDLESALSRTDATLKIKLTLGLPAEDLGATRMDRANILTMLGQFGGAQGELETCLALFQSDPAMGAKVRASLASLFDAQGDVAQAVSQARRALALGEQLPDPFDRASLHQDLANYLERHGTPSTLAESSCHQLASLIYLLHAGRLRSLHDSLHKYAMGFRRACAAGTELAVPSVAELLAESDFHPLKQWLRQCQANADELQAGVDGLLDRVRQTALANP